MTTRSLGEQIRGALVKVITSLFLLLLKEQYTSYGTKSC